MTDCKGCEAGLPINMDGDHYEEIPWRVSYSPCTKERTVTETKPIPVSAAKDISHQYGYDQVVIIARKVGHGEHVTTFGVDKDNCDVAARIGEFLKFKVMVWAKENVKNHD